MPRLDCNNCATFINSGPEEAIESTSATFVFGSDEYNEFVGTIFNDAFCAFLDGVQVSFDINQRPITVTAPKGCVVNAEYPSPVVYANTEISHRACDMISELVNTIALGDTDMFDEYQSSSDPLMSDL
jgi:hypothetical protein